MWLRRWRAYGLALLLVALGACDDCGGESAQKTDDEPPAKTGSPPSAGGTEGDPEGGLPKLKLERAFGDLRFERPLWLTAVPEAGKQYVVLEQQGVVWRVYESGGSWKRAKVLDIATRVRRQHNEEGLLGLAFHPDFPERGEIFLYYSASGPRRTVLSRFDVSRDDGLRVDPTSERKLLQVEQPWGNHNGGTVLFGPNDKLYLSYGDGGAAGDPHENAQDLGTLLGSIIRIDVDGGDGDRPYGIPEDNPFVDREGARPEIWAYGLRNVWRMSFDRKTGTLWAADVGQDAWEEVDVIERGGNYGWSVWEGTHRYEEGEVDGEHIEPVAEYSHDRGKSITGGYVYRGEAIESLVGAYVYADFVSGRMWALRRADGDVQEEAVVAETERPLSSFGEGPDGELFVTAFDGAVHRVVEEP